MPWLGVASQEEEESGLVVTPSALAGSDSRILRGCSTLNVVDSSPTAQLDPRSAERHGRAAQVSPVLPDEEGQLSGGRSAAWWEHRGCPS